MPQTKTSPLLPPPPPQKKKRWDGIALQKVSTAPDCMVLNCLKATNLVGSEIAHVLFTTAKAWLGKAGLSSPRINVFCSFVT